MTAIRSSAGTAFTAGAAAAGGVSSVGSVGGVGAAPARALASEEKHESHRKTSARRAPIRPSGHRSGRRHESDVTPGMSPHGIPEFTVNPLSQVIQIGRAEASMFRYHAWYRRMVIVPEGMRPRTEQRIVGHRRSRLVHARRCSDSRADAQHAAARATQPVPEQRRRRRLRPAGRPGSKGRGERRRRSGDGEREPVVGDARVPNAAGSPPSR